MIRATRPRVTVLECVDEVSGFVNGRVVAVYLMLLFLREINKVFDTIPTRCITTSVDRGSVPSVCECVRACVLSIQF